MIYNKIEELESKIENLDCGTSSDKLQGELDKLNSILIKNRMIECHDEGGNQYNCPGNLLQPCVCKEGERNYDPPSAN